MSTANTHSTRIFDEMVLDLTEKVYVPGCTDPAEIPWPYPFNKGDKAWALGGNKQWRTVTILEAQVERCEGKSFIVYTAMWHNKDGLTMRGNFCPASGDLKPAVYAEHIPTANL